MLNAVYQMGENIEIVVKGSRHCGIGCGTKIFDTLKPIN